MASNYWFDRSMARATEARERARAAMQRAVGRPVLRRPNTKTLLEDAIRSPEGLDEPGRGILARFLLETYGGQARDVFPYLGIEEE